jgi:hypothetical protein
MNLRPSLVFADYRNLTPFFRGDCFCNAPTEAVLSGRDVQFEPVYFPTVVV